MEAVPRLYMICFSLKKSPEGTSFTGLKKYISEFYHEDPESYSKEVFALETLRNEAMHPTKDGCAIMKRYYCQLHSLQNRFPQLADRNIFTFTWKDLYQSQVNEIKDIRYEMAAVLFNIAASHTQVGASVRRGDVDGMKLACTHFQCAAWAFTELRERYANVNSGGDFMTTELLVFMQQVSYAQAQECILEKSLIDNRKPNIVAKVTAQIVVYYGAALAALLTGGDYGPIAQVIGSSVYKLWKNYVRFKISYLNCILYLYQGQHAEEQQKMGERLTLYQAAWEKLEEARKESKGLPDQNEIIESIIFTSDVVEAKRKNAKNENEFIYHEAVPELSTISAIQGANLVNGISFSVTDPEVAGEDIFARLVPMKAHEASSMYSEEKAKILRKYGAQIEEKDAELASYLSSLSLENLNINEEKANKIPQGIVDRCAALNANKTAIPDLIAAMSQLAEICADVEINLKEIGCILAEEERQEQEFQTKSGVKRTPNAHIIELTREFQKYTEAHTRAGESNDTLRKAMELHVNNLKILARPLQEIQQSVPKLSSELNTAEIFKDVKLILNKTNEMKAQRSQFHADLRIAVNDDDITAKVIAHGSDEGLQGLFERELAKHERITQLIEQNLLAQKNILEALTESYAKAAPILKTLSDVKHKRESFFASLAASYDVYEDLLAKSAKGLEFYKKLSGNVSKLLTRCKSARDVQSEERQQRLKNVPVSTTAPTISRESASTISNSTSSQSNTPKLRDYLKAKNAGTGNIGTYGSATSLDGTTIAKNPIIPSIRPNPLGSENPSQAICSNGFYPNIVNTASTAPNEPPPPYSLQQAMYYDSTYHQLQQNMEPPAYTLQASPNSQFSNVNTNISNFSLPHNALGNGSTPALQQNQYASNNANISFPNTQRMGTAFIQQNPNNFIANQNTQTSHSPNQRITSQPSYIQGQAPLSQTSLQYAANKQSNMPSLSVLPTQQYSNNYINATAVNNYQQNTMGVTAPTSQQTYPTQVNQYPQMINPMISQQQQNTNFQSSAPTPSSQPLYVVTSMQDATQTPYMVNPHPAQPPIQQSQQNVSSQQNSNITISTQAKMATPITSIPSSSGISKFSNFSSNTNHPGYSYNPQSGIYEYGSGYHQAANINTQFYGQYTSASAAKNLTDGTTDSESANKINVATGFDSPVISHTKTTAVPPTDSNAGGDANQISYYTLPYGHVSNLQQPNVFLANTSGSVHVQQHDQQQQFHQNSFIQQQQHQQFNQLQQQINQQSCMQQNKPLQQQHSIYMQSGSNSNADTQTTKSAAEYASSSGQHPASATSPETNIKETVLTNSSNKIEAKTNSSSPQKSNQPVTSKPSIKKASNVDLLSDIDFGATGLSVPPPLLPTPILKPDPITSKQADDASEKISLKISNEAQKTLESSQKEEQRAQSPTKAAVCSSPTQTQILSPVSSSVAKAGEESINARKPSVDNLSTCSDLSSIENNFDWDSISVLSDKLSNLANLNASEKHSYTNTFHLKFHDPFSDDKILKYFHKEVERYEKLIENLNVKMLNGLTHLSAKWKELHDHLNKDAGKRTCTIAKLFPEKNRSLDCIPYDHARVKLDKNTDDYINAAYIKNLGAGCPNIIIAQTPQQNTTNDFWSMIWSQKSRTVLCLHTPNEMLDPYWPHELNSEANFDDFTVRCVKINILSHCTEYNLKLSMHGADAIIDLSILQIKTWSKSAPSQLIEIGRNALILHQQHCLEFSSPVSPLIINCLTGSERSELIAIAICAILSTQMTRPVLINVVDVWYRICSQRQNALRSPETLEMSMKIVLNHAHDLLNKRGIMTSYQMKIAPQVTSKEREEIKDPLNELDPLWKLK